MMTKEQAEVIMTYARNGMDARATSKAMYVSDGTVHYYMRRILEATGKDPKDFFDLCFLVGMAQQVLGGADHGT